MMTDKIKIVLIKKKMSVSDLARELKVTPQNLSNKFRRNNFSEKELYDIANALDVEYDARFIFKNGEIV